MVEQQQEKLTEALKLQLSRSHSSDPQVFPNLLLKLSELRTVGMTIWNFAFFKLFLSFFSILV